MFFGRDIFAQKSALRSMFAGLFVRFCRRRLNRVILVLLGLGALGVAAFMGASLSLKQATHVHRPTAPLPSLWEWAWFVGSCLIPALVLGPGMCFWTNWSSRRRLRWCVILLAFPLATLLLHRILAARGFLAVDA